VQLSKGRLLNSEKETRFGAVIRQDLEHALIGQPEAIDYFVQLVEKYKSGLYESGRPIGAVLETGPTGSGKTYAAETFAESLQMRLDRSWKKNMMRIDCGEFQHSHEIAKLVGSPPGYLGHRETKPMLSPERIGLLQSAVMDYPFAILVFDEIEKASDGLWNILLGILDKASLTLGTNEQVDLSQTVIILTSNAGFSNLRDGLGFVPPSVLESKETKRIGVEAAKRKFSVEFINRLDATIGFNALSQEMIAKILKLELGKLQLEVFSKCAPKLLFAVSDTAQAALLKEGYDSKYNARHIKRALSKRLRLPLARIIGGNQVLSTEGVLVDYEDSKYTFKALPQTNKNFVLHGAEDDKDKDILSCTP
jgi:ATP-dependent Clp protease ATP-binding subunit ClpA